MYLSEETNIIIIDAFPVIGVNLIFMTGCIFCHSLAKNFQEGPIKYQEVYQYFQEGFQIPGEFQYFQEL